MMQGGFKAMNTQQSGEEIGRRGQERCQTRGRRLQQRRANAWIYGKRIGYNAVYVANGVH